MANSKIGKLERVPLREIWAHEARDFTQWLQENIEVLNEALGLSLTNVDREQSAGNFSIDLVAEDDDGGHVIIENQLERSDHDHLGKVITYLTGMSAKAAIWIVADPRPEHVAAIGWLNESSSADFYMVKIEAVRIGNSPSAALFTLIVGPSEETRNIGQTKKNLAERHVLRKQWWTQLLARPGAKLHAHIAPSERGWISTSSGIPGLFLNYVVYGDEYSVELYIDRGKGAEEENKAIFDELFSHKAEIEASFRAPLSWERLDNRRASRIEFTRSGGGYKSPEEQWPEIQDAMVDSMNRLEAALRPHLKNLRLGE